jgi:hypothetical protein
MADLLTGPLVPVGLVEAGPLVKTAGLLLILALFWLDELARLFAAEVLLSKCELL